MMTRKPVQPRQPKKPKHAERRHEEMYVIGRWLPPRLATHFIHFMAHLRSLIYLDTRIVSLMSGCINITWAIFVFGPFVLADNYPTGFLARIVWSAPYEIVIPLMLALGLCEVLSSITNNYRWRIICSLLSVMWWIWLTAMSFAATPNESAGVMFAVMTVFRSWTFVTISRTHPEGIHYHANRH
jgi:hypothetical protein